MCVSILGSRYYFSVLAAWRSRLIGHQFLPMLLSLSGFRIGMIIALCIFQVSVQLRLIDLRCW